MACDLKSADKEVNETRREGAEQGQMSTADTNAASIAIAVTTALQRRPDTPVERPRVPCTWPDCSATFTRKADVARHHYNTHKYKQKIIRKRAHSSLSPHSGNHALQDYQTQLMLLEQQNKNRLKLQRSKDPAEGADDNMLRNSPPPLCVSATPQTQQTLTSK
jgi:hypothetical protein